MTIKEAGITNEETLDPQHWDSLRVLAHQMVDDVIDYHRTVRERPVWQPPRETQERHCSSPVPVEGQGLESAYEEFMREILPYDMGNNHSRFFAWVIPPGSASGAFADLLAASMNPNTGGGRHAANLVERQVIDWFKGLFGYPSSASGLLVSGGSLANLTALQVARNVKAAEAGIDVRRVGLRNAPLFRVYYSEQTHSSVQRAIEALGLGSEAAVSLPTDNRFRVDIGTLAGAIEADRAAGHVPSCVVGTAGTTNTSSIDDLNALADICKRERLWFHVDGAIGAVAAMSPKLRPLLAGMERADSIAFDLHKWMYMPYAVGCVLVRSAKDHYETFTLTPEYLAHGDRGLAGEGLWFSDYGLELTRPFRALKVWMLLKEHGTAKYARLMEQNADQACYLGRLVEDSPKLEMLAPVSLMVVCFRYRVEGASDEELDALNEELVFRIQESGTAVPSGTRLKGRYAIRVSILNHRTRREDIDLTLREVLRIGDELREEMLRR